MDKKSKRIIVIGLDAATWDVMLPMIEKGELPNLSSLMHEGTSANLVSTFPSHTPTAFTSFFTGVNPGKHGIYHFYGNLHNNYDNAHLFNYSDIPLKTIFDILTEQNLKVVLLAVPMTYPPPKVNGAVVALRSLGLMKEKFITIHPPELKEPLKEKLGGFDETKLSHVSSGLGDVSQASFYDNTIRKMNYFTEKLRIAILHLLKEDWNFFMVHFQSIDVLQHMFWKFMDKNHIAYEPGVASRYQNVIFDAYRKIDSIIGEVLTLLEKETTVIIMSDHGASPMHRRFNVNRWLQEKGLLTIKSFGMDTHSFVIKYPTVYKLFSRLGLKFIGEILPGPLQKLKIPFLWTQPKSLTQKIDWNNTKAYFAPAGGININLKGREPNGIVKTKKEYEELITYIENELYSLRNPKTGEKVVQHVLRKEDIFHGPLVHESTDIYILFKEDFHCFPHDGISKKEIFSECPKFMKETKEDLNSSHHTAMIRALKGILVIKGPAIQSLPLNEHEANIMDLPPTILYLLGAPIPEHMEGILLEKFIRPVFLQTNPPLKIRLENDGFLKERQKVSFSKEEEELAKEQLKNLGYM